MIRGISTTNENRLSNEINSLAIYFHKRAAILSLEVLIEKSPILLVFGQLNLVFRASFCAK